MVCFCFLSFGVNCIGIKSWILNHGALSVYRGVKWLKSSQKSVKMEWVYTMFWTLQGAFVPKAPHATVFNSCVFNHRSTQNKMNWASVLSHNSDHLQQYCARTMNPFSVHSLISTGVRSQRLYWTKFRVTVVYVIRTTPGGTQIWVGLGCAARASKPIPIFKGDFGQKRVPIFKDFPSKIGLFFKNFVIFGFSPCENPANHIIWGSVRKVDPCLRIFWVKSGTHV